MQVVVLCGGKGTRLNEYTENMPKPLIDVGGKPILWHILQIYKSFGCRDFIFCLGYKGDKIIDYFKNEKGVQIHFEDTGLDANKAERLNQIKYLIKEDDFFVTYGDDLSDVDIKKLYEIHKKSKKIVTLTAVNLESPFGILEFDKKGNVTGFREKPKLDYYMNGGYYVFNNKIFNYMEKGYDLEKETFAELAKINQIAAFKHKGFWKSMNTLKDVMELNEMYNAGETPWIK